MKAQHNQQQTNFGSSAKTHWVAVVALILATATLSAPPASAQTIASGRIEVDKYGGVFTLTGASTALNGFIARGGFINDGGGYIDLFCNPCGNSLPISITVPADAFGSGSAVTWLPKNSIPVLVWYDREHPRGETGLGISGPAIPLNGPGVYSGPFNYSAVLCGEIPPGHDFTCDFNVPPQSGTGHVVVHMAQDPQTGFLYTTSVTYLIP